MQLAAQQGLAADRGIAPFRFGFSGMLSGSAEPVGVRCPGRRRPCPLGGEARAEKEMVAPEPYLSACLHVLYLATVHARSLGYSGQGSIRTRLSRDTSRQLADLMDAVHNLPHMINAWETCDEDRLRADLSAYDEKWGHRYPLKLLPPYEQALSGDLSSFG